MRKKSNLTKIN